ncbi:hypothetical protein BGX31_001533, partial [Mortierella sp. GBA43]
MPNLTSLDNSAFEAYGRYSTKLGASSNDLRAIFHADLHVTRHTASPTGDVYQ